jgi:hypothetical protein
MTQFDKITIQLPEIVSLNLREPFLVKRRTKVEGIYRVSKTGKLYKAVHKKVEKSKDEILTDYTNEVMKYSKIPSSQKELFDEPKKERYKIVFDKWDRDHFDGELECINSERGVHLVRITFSKGIVGGRVTIENPIDGGQHKEEKLYKRVYNWVADLFRERRSEW